MYRYNAVKHDCENVIDILWQLVNSIADKKEITISYYKVDRTLSEKRVLPVSIMFSEYYFYLIAYYPEKYNEPRYFRADRITNIVEHRKKIPAEGISDTDELVYFKRIEQLPGFDEGELRQRNQFMFYGKLRRIKFWYTGPGVQAMLDKLPTAKVVERKRNKYLLEADVYGDGIKMFLLSQGTWVKAVEPEEFVDEMKDTVRSMAGMYGLDKITGG
jgi:predicted DNA-binding transcriptional regulator YafY